MSRAYPIPEVLRRKDKKGKPILFKVRPLQGSETPRTSAKSGQMVVPIDDSVNSTWIRRHEMAHIKWSPDEGPRPGSLQQYILACEDARVNQLLARSRFDTNVGSYPESVATVESMLPGDAALLRVSVAGTSEEGPIAKWLHDTNAELADITNQALRIMRQDLDSYDSTLKAARYLKDEFDRRGIETSTPPPSSGPDGGYESGDIESCDKGGGGAVYVNKYVTGRHNLPSIWHAPLRSIGWGSMSIVRPPLPSRLPAVVGRGKWRPSDSGAVPRRMERWTTDQAVFSTRGRKRSGTVLIDASGSMRLNSDQIKECLTQAPAATIAMYCGELNEGCLYILARRGRSVSTVPKRIGSGNIVDGPALRWLATQKPPRIWVCDEDVTGVGDVLNSHLLGEARGICRTFGIMRVNGLNDAAMVLGRKPITIIRRKYKWGGVTK